MIGSPQNQKHFSTLRKRQFLRRRDLQGRARTSSQPRNASLKSDAECNTQALCAYAIFLSRSRLRISKCGGRRRRGGNIRWRSPSPQMADLQVRRKAPLEIGDRALLIRHSWRQRHVPQIEPAISRSSGTDHRRVNRIMGKGFVEPFSAIGCAGVERGVHGIQYESAANETSVKMRNDKSTYATCNGFAHCTPARFATGDATCDLRMQRAIGLEIRVVGPFLIHQRDGQIIAPPTNLLTMALAHIRKNCLGS